MLRTLQSDKEWGEDGLGSALRSLPAERVCQLWDGGWQLMAAEESVKLAQAPHQQQQQQDDQQSGEINGLPLERALNE